MRLKYYPTAGEIVKPFSPEVFGKVPAVYVVSDARRLDGKALRVNHDSAELGRLAARELLFDGARGFGYFGVVI